MIRFAIFCRGINTYKDQRTFKTMKYAKKKMSDLCEIYDEKFTIVPVEVKSKDGQIEQLQQELQKTREQLEKAEKAIGQIDKIIESDNFEGYSDEYREKRNVIDRYFKDKQGE